MPSSDAHCSKIDSSLYGLLINGRMTSLFLQASQKKRDSGVDIRVADNGGTLLLVMMSMTLSSSACRITNQHPEVKYEPGNTLSSGSYLSSLRISLHVHLVRCF